MLNVIQYQTRYATIARSVRAGANARVSVAYIWMHPLPFSDAAVAAMESASFLATNTCGSAATLLEVHAAPAWQKHTLSGWQEQPH